MTQTSKAISQRLKDAGKRFWAGDNISEFIHDGEKEILIDDLAIKFKDVLEGLVIDVENIPASPNVPTKLFLYFTPKACAASSIK